MPKPKVKDCVMGTKATETAPGQFEFEVGDYQYRFSVGMGLNTSSRAKGDEDWTPILYCKNIDLAVMYAWGYDAGLARNRHPAA